MQSLDNRLAMQHFVNAYTQETSKAHLLDKTQQSPQQQGLIPMPEETAMLYYCFRKTFYNKFGEYYQTSQQQLADQPAKHLSRT